MRIWEILEQLRIVERLWQMSLLACMLIGFVLLLRLLMRKCSKGYSYGYGCRRCNLFDGAPGERGQSRG